MSIDSKYDKYLRHLGNVGPVRNLLSKAPGEFITGLRHDVDHDLDIALEMADFEHKQGVHSTYYLLHTASYWRAEDFEDKVRQLHSYGHEVGIHLNVITQWLAGDIDKVDTKILEIVSTLSEIGVPVNSVSAHGDRNCYTHQYINYWCFEELRPSTSCEEENRLSAEGIPVNDAEYQISYPESHQLVRSDGTIFPLWSVSMRKCGFEYEAMHLPFDNYYSDSGGAWTRTPDPLTQEFNSSSSEVVIHPEYWLAPQKIYFFLSAPRSGSTWLANMLEKASNCTARHEFLLNHEFENGELLARKRTEHDLSSLLDDPELVKRLLLQGKSWIQQQGKDYAEVNVYLSHFVNEVREIFPEATIIHLQRKPEEVAVSLLGRGWYGTPGSSRGPGLDIPGFNEFEQFEKICWYVRQSMENIDKVAEHWLAFEKMVTDMEYLDTQLGKMGISLYRQIADLYFSVPLNEGKTDPVADQGQEQERMIGQTCNSVFSKFANRDATNPGLWQKLVPYSRRLRRRMNAYLGRIFDRDSELLSYEPGSENSKEMVFWAKSCGPDPDDTSCYITSPGEHSNLVPGEGKWYEVLDEQGFNNDSSNYYHGVVRISGSEPFPITLFCLMYNEERKLVDTAVATKIYSNDKNSTFSFRPRADTYLFQLAIYIPARSKPVKFKLEKLILRSRTWRGL